MVITFMLIAEFVSLLQPAMHIISVYGIVDKGSALWTDGAAAAMCKQANPTRDTTASERRRGASGN